MNKGFLVLFALVAVANCDNFFPQFPTPAFLWAGNQFFTEKHVENLESIPMDALTDLVSKVTDPTARVYQADLIHYVSQPAAAPEVMVIYLEPKAELAHSEYSFLQASVTSAASSVLVPNLYQSSFASASESLGNVLINHAETTVVADNKGPDAILLSQFSQFLADNNEIFSNGVADVIVVYLPGDSTKSAVFTDIQKQINEKSGGNFVAVYTAETGFSPAPNSRRASRREIEAHDLHVRAAAAAAPQNVSNLALYWPRQVWEGMIVFAVLGFLLVIGLGCTFALQTPSKWEQIKAHQE